MPEPALPTSFLLPSIGAANGLIVFLGAGIGGAIRHGFIRRLALFGWRPRTDLSRHAISSHLVQLMRIKVDSRRAPTLPSLG